MKLNDAVIGLALLLLAAAVLAHVRGFPSMPGQDVGPALFPGLVAAGLAGCGVVLVASGLRRRPAVPWAAFGPWLRSAGHRLNFVTVVAALLFYILAADRLGFLISGTLILVALFAVLRVRPLMVLPLAVAVTLLIQQVFQQLLRVPLPRGLLPPPVW